MKKSDAISFIIFLIIGLVVLVLVIVFVAPQTFKIMSSQQNLSNTSNNALNQTFGNISNNYNV
jgi:archaellum component FlaG (FlaF/FlaG flagellin family)